MKNADYRFLLAPQYIALFVLIVAAAIAGAIALKRIFNALTRKATGWRALTQRFPAIDAHKFGGSYKKRNGIFGNNECNGFFLIELAHEGLLITADFDRTPILIPWSAISAIDESSIFGFITMVHLTVNYERKLIFDVPKDALKAIQENVPAERFHQTNFFELVKQNLLNNHKN
jgi:hypothetical protein